VDLYPAICKVGERRSRRQPEAVKDGVCFLASGDAKTSSIQQLIQRIGMGHSAAHFQGRSHPIQLDEPVEADLRGCRNHSGQLT
jgi:hypothetical protein